MPRAEGILDLAYAEVDSPLGRLLAVGTPAGLVHLGYPNRALDSQLELLARRISPRIVESPRDLDPVRRELDEYFEGARRDFDLDLDWQLTAGFVRAVLERTAAIPFGETRTYGEVAAAAGSPRAFRAAGTRPRRQPDPDRRPLPPGAAQWRRPRRLRRRARRQARAAAARGRALAGSQQGLVSGPGSMTSKALPGIDLSWFRFSSFQRRSVDPEMNQFEPLSATIRP